MKRSNKYIGSIFAAALLLAGCSPEDYNGVSMAGLPIADNYADSVVVTVDQTTNWAYFTFKNTRGVNPVWITEDGSYIGQYTYSKYYRKKGTYSIECKVRNANGMSDGSIIKEFTIDQTKISGFGGFAYDSEYNQWRQASVAAPTFWFANSSWSQVADPTCSFNGQAYSLKTVENTTDQWQAQMKISSDISTSSEKTYDFSVLLTADQDITATVKLTYDGNDGSFFQLQNEDKSLKVQLKKDEPLAVFGQDMPGHDLNNVQLVLDFGGTPAGVTIAVEDIVFKDHAYDDGTTNIPAKPTSSVTWSAPDSKDNLWNVVPLPYRITQYTAQGDGWSGLPSPAYTLNGKDITISMVDGTNLQWQQQFAIYSDGALQLSADKTYDVKVTFISNNEIPQSTLKLCNGVAGSDDNPYLMSDNITIEGGNAETEYKLVKIAGQDIPDGKFVFDFGGNPAGTTLQIKDIIVQEHKD